MDPCGRGQPNVATPQTVDGGAGTLFPRTMRILDWHAVRTAASSATQESPEEEIMKSTSLRAGLAACIVLATALVPVSASAWHRFHGPRLRDRPIDRCIRSPRFDGCRPTGGGNFACVDDQRLDRCGEEAQQEVADAFCAEHGYDLGASDFATEFVGPWPHDVMQLTEPRDGGLATFRGIQGWDVFTYIECRTRQRTNWATIHRPTVGTYRVDRCVNHLDFGFFERCNTDAQALSADEFCQRRGYDFALDWALEIDVGLHSIFFLERTWSGGLRSGFGQMPGSEALKDVRCEAEPPPLPRFLLDRLRPRFPLP